MPKRTKSSAAWLAEHESDPFVKRAREEGWRSRAVFKLEEIQKSDRILRPGMTIVDLGAAPGSWSQYTKRLLDGKGRIIAMDILDMPAIPGVEFLLGDFNDDAILEQLFDLVGPATVDLLTDIGPVWAPHRDPATMLSIVGLDEGNPISDQRWVRFQGRLGKHEGPGARDCVNGLRRQGLRLSLVQPRPQPEPMPGWPAFAGRTLHPANPLCHPSSV